MWTKSSKGVIRKQFLFIQPLVWIELEQEASLPGNLDFFLEKMKNLSIIVCWEGLALTVADYEMKKRGINRRASLSWLMRCFYRDCCEWEHLKTDCLGVGELLWNYEDWVLPRYDISLLHWGCVSSIHLAVWRMLYITINDCLNLRNCATYRLMNMSKPFVLDTENQNL